jgi:hypothetical protein
MRTARFLTTGLILVAFALQPPVAVRVAWAQPDARPIWFDDLVTVPAPGSEQSLTVAQMVAASVFGGGRVANPVTPPPLENRRPWILFLSVSDGASPARVLVAVGESLGTVLEDADSQVRLLRASGHQPRWLKVDVVRDAIPLEGLDVDQPLPIEPTLDGLAFSRQSGVAFLPEELVAALLISSKRELQPGRIGTYLAPRPGQRDSFRELRQARAAPEYRFRTLGFFSDGGDVLPLYRGHRLFGDEMSVDVILDAARSAGSYLADATGPDGRFAYEYRPPIDAEADAYNIVRHAGTAYSMFELYQVTRDGGLLDAATKALGYLLAGIQPCRVGEAAVACVVENDEVKLGGNGLAVVALAKYTEVTGDRQYLPLMRQLAGWIRAVQGNDGAFSIHKQNLRSGAISSFESNYYPGEALLALDRIYAVDPDEGWLDTAEQGALYLINVRDGGLADDQLDHDHWLLYALNDLYRHRPNPIYLEHAMRIAGAIVATQQIAPSDPDWAGGYLTASDTRGPRSTPTAIRTEGLSAAYLLARDFGKPAQADAIRTALRRGVAFQLQTQYRPESVLYFKNPRRALGGFHGSLVTSEIRIDYVQHNISSLLALHRIEAD